MNNLLTAVQGANTGLMGGGLVCRSLLLGIVAKVQTLEGENGLSA